METGIEVTPRMELGLNTPEARFKKLSENTHGVLTKVEDPNINSSIPFIINYPEKSNQTEKTVRVYRGVRYVATNDCSQKPSLLKTPNVDSELVDLTIELADNPSPAVYEKIRAKNLQLGNDNYSLDKAEKYIQQVMRENDGDYVDAFKNMHKWENTASPFVATSGQLNQAFSYAMRKDHGMVIVADVPESLINYDFNSGYDKEIAVKGILKQEYIKSILLVTSPHNIEDKVFINSVESFIK